MEIIARNLERLMKEKGLNQAKLAEKANMSPQQMSSILIKDADLRISTVTKLANALDINISELIDSNTKSHDKSNKDTTNSLVDFLQSQIKEKDQQIRFLMQQLGKPLSVPGRGFMAA